MFVADTLSLDLSDKKFSNLFTTGREFVNLVALARHGMHCKQLRCMDSPSGVAYACDV